MLTIEEIAVAARKSLVEVSGDPEWAAEFSIQFEGVTDSGAKILVQRYHDQYNAAAAVTDADMRLSVEDFSERIPLLRLAQVGAA
jgi:hypothetical protein